ncbi:hypothetical protein [Yoonia sp. R2-816]|uniref:hypothetical protein n=1 Tax=Yoonia sp. R2-816 TaxID=3342638 RepID=UPI00372656F0
MGASINAIFGGAFLLLALFLTFLMFYLWKFPFDKEKHQSAAPRSLMTLHRLFGYVFVAIYIILMWDMVPRLWSYQIELPARTVLHLTLGLAVGAILIVKIMVVRFFKHMESTLAPLLGTSLLICTLLLTGLALPYAAREAYLRATAQDGQNFAQDRIDRVVQFLPQIGFSDEAGLRALASSAGLAEGRDVLTRKCTQCHDLRTILVRPRTPEAWRSTVARMATRSTTLNTISESEEWSVTAYLIAISPTLREVATERRALTVEVRASQEALRLSATRAPDYDPDAARQVFEAKCAQCHAPTLVEQSTFNSADDIRVLVTRMVGNGLTADDGELGQIIAYLAETYARAEGQ